MFRNLLDASPPSTKFDRETERQRDRESIEHLFRFIFVRHAVFIIGGIKLIHATNVEHTEIQ